MAAAPKAITIKQDGGQLEKDHLQELLRRGEEEPAAKGPITITTESPSPALDADQSQQHIIARHGKVTAAALSADPAKPPADQTAIEAQPAPAAKHTFAKPLLSPVCSSCEKSTGKSSPEEEEASGAVLSCATLEESENISAHQAYINCGRNGGGLSPHLSMTPSTLDESESSKNRSPSSSSITTVTGPNGSTRSFQQYHSPHQRLGENEETDFANVDRYGYYITPSSSRQNGQQREESAEDRRLQQKLERRNDREARRAMKWVEMMLVLEKRGKVSDWPLYHRKFASRLVKGVPDCIRIKLWLVFVKDIEIAPYDFLKLQSRISGFERQIDVDVERTLRDHVLFKPRFSQAQISLFKILAAYANYDKGVGYCQGMSTVAAFLLTYFDEELSFRVFAQIMKKDQLRKLYMAGFPLLFESFYIQEQLMQKYTPMLYKKLVSYNIGASVYATKWYLTMFLGFSCDLSLRFWDLFLFYGFDMLIVITLALLKYFEGVLCRLDYERCMQFLSHLPDSHIDEDNLIKLVMKIWRKLCSKGPPETRVFAVLRRAFAKLQDMPTKSVAASPDSVADASKPAEASNEKDTVTALYHADNALDDDDGAVSVEKQFQTVKISDPD